MSEAQFAYEVSRQQEEAEYAERIANKWPGVLSWPGKKETPVKSIASALVVAQRKFGPALKSNTNPHFKSKYADLSAVIEAVIDGLNDAGIALIQATHECENGVIVETLFIHESGEQLSAGRLHVPASKHDAQGYGSALTYARRYSLMAACGIAPEDDDGNAATRKSVIAASFKSTPTDGPIDIADERRTIIELAASVAANRFKEGMKDEAFDMLAEFFKDNEEALYLHSVLKPYSTLRAYIKFRQEAQRPAQPVTTEEEFQ